jgi:GTP cyclohydrolase I
MDDGAGRRDEADVDAVRRFLRAIGAPLDRDPELAETPMRVLDAWKNDLLSGYAEDPARILADTTRTTDRGAVLVEGIATSVICPHHLLPSAGTARVAYLPGGRVVGLGALARIVHCFARRLAIQEAVGRSVVDALIEHLGARAAACELDLAPGCVTVRGAREPSARSRSLAFAGDTDADGFGAWFIARRNECAPT